MPVLFKIIFLKKVNLSSSSSMLKNKMLGRGDSISDQEEF
jgi:hypothetical protein